MNYQLYNQNNNLINNENKEKYITIKFGIQIAMK